jgi:hypothetical protein
VDLGPPDFDRLFEAYESSLAVYSAHEDDLFPSTEVRLAIVTSMIAAAERGERDPKRLAAAGLLAVGLAPIAVAAGPDGPDGPDA